MICLFTVVALNAQSGKKKQKIEPKKIVYTVHPVEFAISEMKQSFEFKFKEGKRGIGLIPSVIYEKKNGDTVWGFTTEVQYRLYVNAVKFNEDPTTGRLYMSPFAKGIIAEEKDYWTENETVTSDLVAGEFGNLFGYQKISDFGLTFDFAIGGSIRFADISTTNELYKATAFDSQNKWGLGYQGIKPKLHFSIGYAF